MTNKTLEQEANLFAMLLLMPKQCIAEDIAAGLDLTDNDKLKVLAKKYDVPLTALAIRIAYYLKHKR
jgi:Zn-dependent peptidase ImmA (M78 family)